MLHPEVALRSCDDCCKFMYEDDGRPMRRPKIGGPRVPRLPNVPPACRVCPKIPPGVQATPGAATVIDDRTLEAWEFYRRCVALGNKFPDDEAVELLAVQLADVEREVAEIREERRMARMVAALATVGQVRGQR
ncbi:MAG: hypothetical protein K1X57_20910 [Gemmataceae bacterium]|nr:hypothetical protein [Gemmataceae bacterium]